ncbi:hypothetical protein D3C81_1560990 [compost metagenome]
MLGIEKQASEYFAPFVTQLGFQIATYRARALQRRVANYGLFQVPTTDFHHGLQLGVFRRPQPDFALKRGLVCLKQMAQTAKLLQQMPGQVDGAHARYTGA